MGDDVMQRLRPAGAGRPRRDEDDGELAEEARRALPAAGGSVDGEGLPRRPFSMPAGYWRAYGIEPVAMAPVGGIALPAGYLAGLVAPAAAAPVQRLAGPLPSLDDEEAREAARRGTRGAGGPLPHREALQRSFGRHDLQAVEAHRDPAAAEAARAIGARAFTAGNHVAFDGEPDLRTAAHEAAHVVQQRAGVHLPGGVGRAGDAYERHADEVADRVVRGESAEALLDRYAAPAASPAPPSALDQASAGRARREGAATLSEEATAVASAPSPRLPDALAGAPVQRDDAPGGPPAGEQPLDGEGTLKGDQTPVYRDPDTGSPVVMTLPQSPAALQVVGQTGDFYIVNVDGQQRGYVHHDGIEVAPRSDRGDDKAADTAPAAEEKMQTGEPGQPGSDAVHTPQEKKSPGERFRAQVLELLKNWDGATEGGAAGAGGSDYAFSRFADPASLKQSRQQAALEKKTYTTCVSFMGFLKAAAATKAGVTLKNVAVDVNLAVPTSQSRRLLGDAWHEGKAGMTDRPRAGDIYLLTFAHDVKSGGKLVFGKGWFSHFGFIREAPQPSADGKTETWTVEGGGQGTAGKYAASYAPDDTAKKKPIFTETQKGAEQIASGTCTYHPDTNIIGGDPNQATATASDRDKEKTLLGWIDIEKLVSDASSAEGG